MSVLHHLLGQKAVCLSREVRIPYSVSMSLGDVRLDSQPLEAIVLPAGRTAFWQRCVNRRDTLFLWKQTPKVLITSLPVLVTAAHREVCSLISRKSASPPVLIRAKQTEIPGHAFAVASRSQLTATGKSDEV